MKVPLLDLKPQLAQLRPEIMEAVTQVVDSTSYIMGPQVIAFEQEVADYSGTTYGVGVSSGTDALLASLMSLDIGPGDKVLTTPYTFFATMGTVVRIGAQPVFVDIEPHSFNMNPDEVERLLAEDHAGKKQIKAIIPVHLYGQCADMQRLCQLSQHYNVPIIEDAAQAIGAEYPFVEGAEIRWAKAGSMGLCGCFSFFPSKNLGGIGDGGMITTSDADFAAIIRSNRNHGAEPKYYHSRVGGNFRLDSMQAAVLSVKLRYLEEWHAGRRRNAALYRQLFVDAGLSPDQVTLPQDVYAGVSHAEEHNHHIYNQFVILVQNRDALRTYLLEHEIGCEIYYPLCLHQQECLASAGYGQQHYPVAEQAAATSLALPIFSELTQEQISYVVETIKNFYK